MVDVNKKIHIGIIPDGNRRWCKENQHNINYLKTKRDKMGHKILIKKNENFFYDFIFFLF